MTPSRRSQKSEVPHIPSETQYLIKDVEELVNQNVEKYLENEPYRVKVKNYMPELPVRKGLPQLPIGVKRIELDVIDSVASASREFVGMDLLFSYPLTKSNAEENPINVTLKWSDSIQTTLALVDSRPVILVSNGEEAEHVLYAAESDPNTMRTYLETVGLPPSFWDEDFKRLLQDMNSSKDISFARHSRHLLDLGTTMDISYDARYMENNHGEKELVQELCLNIDHTGEPLAGAIRLPGLTYRNMFRFERGQYTSEWEYRGTYSGKLVAGEFIDEQVQENPALGVPGAKLLEKAFYFLNETPN